MLSQRAIGSTTRRPLAFAIHLALSKVGYASSIPKASPQIPAEDKAPLPADRSALSPTRWISPGPPVLTLAAADEMANAAISEATARRFNDISVIVVDASGRTIVSKTMINCPSLPQKLAHAKAMLCVSTHAASSRALRDKYVPDRAPQLLAMTIIGTDSGMPLAAFPGGVLCRDPSNVVVGAIGVSGATADEDEHCAIVAAQAVGLRTEPSSSSFV